MVYDFRCTVKGIWFRIQGFGSRVKGEGFTVQVLELGACFVGFRVLDLR
jgi:hypothetical protein